MKITVVDKGVEKSIDSKYLAVNGLTLEELSVQLSKYKELVESKQAEVIKLSKNYKNVAEQLEYHKQELEKFKGNLLKLQEFFVKMLEAFMYRGDNNG